MLPRELTERIKSLALDEGFDAIGVTGAGPVPRSDGLRTWLGKGFHADMHYMAKNLPLRHAPEALVEGAASVICLASSYAPPEYIEGASKWSWPAAPTAAKQASPGRPDGATLVAAASAGSAADRSGSELIARYARGRDYHKVLKKRCIRLMDRIREVEPSFQGRAFVDWAPVMERSLAAAAGVGWIGRNGCLIVPGLGSYVLLSEIISNLRLEVDQPLECQCQDCGRCSAACPTGGLNHDGLIDARRCISYLTIENRGPIDPMYWARIGQRVVGCDACQQACPFNFAVPPGDPELQPDRPALGGAGLAKVLQWTQAHFDAATAGTAVRRVNYDMFLRNAVIASGNGGDASLVPLLARLRGREAIPNDLLDWAVSRIESREC